MDSIKPMRLRAALAMGAIFTLLYFLLAWNRIDGQGLYYDELHQAPAAFSYIGLRQPIFSIGFSSLPLLTTSYGGAIKSALYGAYLRLTGKRFSVVSWRALGIGIVMIGILSFSLLARSGLSLPQLAVFLTFLCSDATVILATRHDWGPAALALSLRLVFLGIVLRARSSATASVLTTALLGAVVGFSIYEKLSSLVMLAPLALVLLFDSRRHSGRHYMALAGGFVAGVFPLAIVNIGALIKHGVLVSLTNMSDPAFQTHRSLGGIVWELLAQSNGKRVEDFILGTASPVPQAVEVVLMSTVMLVVLVHGLYRWRKDRALPLYGVLSLSYLAMVASLAALPRTTWAHHWIIVTPFQYASIALWLPEALQGLRGRAAFFTLTALMRTVWLSTVALLLVSHFPPIYTVERALSEGKASLAWDRSLTRLADFANKYSSHSAFIAAGWGVGIQILCMGNGQRDLVYEPFWKYQGRSDLESIVRNSKKDVFYIISLAIDSLRGDPTEASIRRDADSVALWRPVPTEPQAEDFRAIRIKKYERVAVRPF